MKPMAGKAPIGLAGLPGTPCNHLGYVVPLMSVIEEMPLPDATPFKKRWPWSKAPKPKAVTITRTTIAMCMKPGCNVQFQFGKQERPEPPNPAPVLSNEPKGGAL